jgi:hypothetical protein
VAAFEWAAYSYAETVKLLETHPGAVYLKLIFFEEDLEERSLLLMMR